MTKASLLRAEEGIPRGVQGAADPRFGNVVRVFNGLFPRRRFGGGALSVFIDGRPVVDVWTGWSDRAGAEPWTADTGAMVFSATKGVAATVIHRLVDRGLLSYDEPVAEYWPESGANGKAEIIATSAPTSCRNTVRATANQRSQEGCGASLNRHDAAGERQRQVVIGDDARRRGDDGWDRVDRRHRGDGVAEPHEVLHRLGLLDEVRRR
jgi:Beta-lactamase